MAGTDRGSQISAGTIGSCAPDTPRFAQFTVGGMVAARGLEVLSMYRQRGVWSALSALLSTVAANQPRQDL